LAAGSPPSPQLRGELHDGGRLSERVFANGGWKGILDAVEAYKSQRRVYVTIQFGHNEVGEFYSQFEVNLERMGGRCGDGTGCIGMIIPVREERFGTVGEGRVHIAPLVRPT